MRVIFGKGEGEHTLDSETRELLHGRNRVHLSTKAFQLLDLLLRDRPRAVSKVELQRRLWPDTFVQESNLASLVSEIRRALGEGGSRAGCLRTVHGFGYAFSGDAREVERHTLVRLTWPEGQVGLGEGDHVLGRDPRAAVFVDSTTVSWRHALLRVSVGAAGPQASVEDLGSRNGTFLNELRLEAPHEARDADEIRVGSVSITVRIVHVVPKSRTDPWPEPDRP